MAVLIPIEKLAVPDIFHVAGDLSIYLGSTWDAEDYVKQKTLYWKATLEFRCQGSGRSGEVYATTYLPNHLEWAFSDKPFVGSHLIQRNETLIAEWLADALVAINMFYATRLDNMGSDTSNYIFEVSFLREGKLKFFVPVWDLRGIIMPKSIVREHFQLDEKGLSILA